MGGVKGEDLRGPTRLLKALVREGRERKVKEFYGLMKRDGCVPNEYLFGFLVRGLRRLGDEEGQRPVADPAKRAISFICFQMLWESDEIELGSCSVPTSESVLSTTLFWGWEEQKTLSPSLRMLKGFRFGLK
ncbi:uncharacterized protein A4U43_C04F9610 [Asparagus officinalis]|uniref:Pentacotripeptide-repeat region of PRORP domain-containing protein n=1 Tax=Asparagus officinalis TaxID=4686 RepID=A0A5P1F021_ASPOF|nr:uncharacterized protein A4U43_C04F9610 [Asparagus officinalis]